MEDLGIYSFINLLIFSAIEENDNSTYSDDRIFGLDKKYSKYIEDMEDHLFDIKYKSNITFTDSEKEQIINDVLEYIDNKLLDKPLVDFFIFSNFINKTISIEHNDDTSIVNIMKDILRDDISYYINKI